MPTLDWLNREEAFKIAKGVPYRLLTFVSLQTSAIAKSPADASIPAAQNQAHLLEIAEKLAKNTSEQVSPTHDNLLVQGDNLEALKALLPLYRGQVKCIFIDPPYNTKSAFEHYDDNLEHAQWLSMMLPRLQLLREFLREDGSIWVTIDDNEGHYLKVMMDEVFGRKSHIASIIWENFYGRSNAAAISPAHNYLHVYAPLGKERWKEVRGLLKRSERSASKYKNPDNDPRGPWRLGPIFASEERHEGLMYTITTPSGRKISPPSGSHWRMTEEDFWVLAKESRIVFGKSGSNVPAIKLFLNEVQAGVVPRSIWAHTDAGHTQDGKKEVLALFPGETPFGTPKPERLLENVFEIATNPNDLVLDSFLGSGTTAAVAHKMGRRWIGIEMGEHARTHCLPRLQKVLDGEQGGISKSVNWQGGGSFQFAQLGETVFDAQGAISPNVRFRDLAAFVWMQETQTPWPHLRTRGAHAKHDGGDVVKNAQKLSPLLGVHNGIAIFMLFNGVLGDKRPNGGNVLTRAVLDHLVVNFPHAGPRIVYGESDRVGEDRLNEHTTVFCSIPHQVQAR